MQNTSWSNPTWLDRIIFMLAAAGVGAIWDGAGDDFKMAMPLKRDRLTLDMFDTKPYRPSNLMPG
jgi:hypothetical protein